MQISFKAEDGIALGGYQLNAEQAVGVVLLNPGTATKTTFYMPFAEFLVQHGFHVILWNYRGFCESRSFSLKHANCRYSDIGNFDIPAAITYAKTQFPDLPLLCVGHSAGGQQIGIAHNSNTLDGLIAVAASAGFYRHMPLAYRLKAYFFFYVFAPITHAVFGYIPAKKLNLMEDLPGPLAREWGNWCRHESLYFSPQFLGTSVPENAYKDVEFPIHVFSADDDEISTEKNLENFWRHVSSQHPINFTRYRASDSLKKHIGHFGYFKKDNLQIWQDILDKLKAML
ncbi:hypothetical protein TDB9533_00729 [Thalassocella blandensis]|nr:hypothetical protein TDB9533_00729 [Thalassocella blandensis]